MSEPCWNVVAVNRDKGLAVVETGGEYPITKYLDGCLSLWDMYGEGR